MENKVSFFLMGHKGLEVLLYLLNSKLTDNIDIVIVSKDKNVNDDCYNDICAICNINNVKYCDKGSIFKIRTKYSIAISWRWIIHLEQNQKLIVLHDSLLPRLRGFNPLVTSLINGDKIIGVTAIFASENFDEGQIIDQKCIEINYPIKIEDAIRDISRCYTEIIVQILNKILNKIDIISKIQDNRSATYSLWRDENDYLIDWNKDAEYILRFINSVGFPYKGAKTIYNGTELRIFDAEIVTDIIIENRTPGKVFFKDNNGLTIVCGKGMIKVKDFFFNDMTKFNYSKLFRLRFQ